MIFPAQSVIQSQTRRDFPIVLDEERVCLGVTVTVRLVDGVELRLVGDTQQECGIGIANQRARDRIVERVDTQALRRVYVGAQAVHETVIAAELHRVAVLVEGDVVENLKGVLPGNSRRISACLLESGDREIRNGVPSRIWRQTGQTELAGNLAG